MSKENVNNMSLAHNQVVVNGISIHVVTGGRKTNSPILFLHGYPESWLEFEQVMLALKDDFFVLAIDLPGIGLSDSIATGDKKSIAELIRALIKTLDLKNVTLAGHDAGGMITYSFLKSFPGELSGAIIMNVVIPGVEPWSTVIKNPDIWHFTFHKIKDLPEILVKDRQRKYFDYFFDTIAKTPARIANRARDLYAAAYSRDVSLKTGFDWYRTFDQDAKDNVAQKNILVETPLLYVRGDSEYGDIKDYLTGFREHNLLNVQGKVIQNCGHYSPEEAPGDIAVLIKEFVKPGKSVIQR